MAKITNQSSISATYTLPDYTKKTLTTQSNISETENMSTSFVKTKSSTRTHVVAEDEIEIELVLQNDSPYELENVEIVDTFSDNMIFVTGSVEIDGASEPTFDVQNSFTLKNPIAANDSVKVTYKAEISESSLTSAFCISNIAYDVNGVHLSENSNRLTFEVENIDVSIQKTSDKDVVVAGEEITFQNIIRNDGSVDATGISFQDLIPTGTTFVAGSVEIDGTKKEDFNPSDGFALSDLAVGSQTVVTFKVVVNE